MCPEKICGVMLASGSVLLILYLGSQVVADVADIPDVVLHHQGNVRGHGQRHLMGRNKANYFNKNGSWQKIVK